MPQKRSCSKLAKYLNEIWKESSQQHSLQQLVLVAVLVAESSVLLTIAGIRHQLSFVQVGAELRDEPWRKLAQQEGKLSAMFTGYCDFVSVQVISTNR